MRTMACSVSAMATGIPMVRLATRILLGASLADMGWEPGLAPIPDLVAVKAPVFSMAKLSGVDTYLGPEMKSTGEVMGVDHSFAPALLKAMIAAGNSLPSEGNVLLSIADRDKPESTDIIRRLASLGYRLVATEGTGRYIGSLGLPVQTVAKLGAGSPNVEEFIRSGSSVLILNTLTGRRQALQDGHHMRRAAAETRTPCFTNLETARTLIDALGATHGQYDVRTIGEYRGTSSVRS